MLRLLAGGQEMGVRLTDLAATSGLKRATLHRILRVLVEEGAVEQDPQTRHYLIGPEVSLFGLARMGRFPIRGLARPGLEQLCRQLGDTVFLSLRTGTDSICVDRLVGSWPLQVLALEIGARRPLGVGVSGVAMLAAMPEDQSARIIAGNVIRLERYRLDGETLADQVRLARQRGYAYAPNGIVRGTRAVAVAVLDTSGHAIAAISIAGMANRLTAARIPEIVARLHEQTAGLSRLLVESGRRRSAREHPEAAEPTGGVSRKTRGPPRNGA